MPWMMSGRNKEKAMVRYWIALAFIFCGAFSGLALPRVNSNGLKMVSKVTAICKDHDGKLGTTTTYVLSYDKDGHLVKIDFNEEYDYDGHVNKYYYEKRNGKLIFQTNTIFQDEKMTARWDDENRIVFFTTRNVSTAGFDTYFKYDHGYLMSIESYWIWTGSVVIHKYAHADNGITVYQGVHETGDAEGEYWMAESSLEYPKYFYELSPNTTNDTNFNFDYMLGYAVRHKSEPYCHFLSTEWGGRHGVVMPLEIQQGKNHPWNSIISIERDSNGDIVKIMRRLNNGETTVIGVEYVEYEENL